MSRDNPEWWALNLELKDIVQHIQSGRRVTRSIKSSSNPPSVKHIDPKPRQHTINLLPYEGQPCLTTYLSASNITYRNPVKEGYFLNVKLKRLNKHNFPQQCLLYEKSYTGVHTLKEVKMCLRKAKPHEFLIEERNNSNQVRSIANAEIGVLAIPQALVFVLIDFPEFQKVFGQVLADLKKKYRRGRLEYLAQSQMVEQKDRSHQSQNLESNPCEMVGEDKEDQNLVNINPSNSQQEIKEKSESSAKIKEPFNEQSIELANKLAEELKEYDQRLFTKLSRGKPYLLWPSLALQALNTDKRELELLASKENCELEDQSQLTELQRAFEEAMDSKSEGDIDRYARIEESLRSKVQQLGKGKGGEREGVVVRLLFSEATKMVDKSLIKWEQFSQEQVNHLVKHSFLRCMVQELNLQIQSLNKFKAYESSTFEGKHSLFRIAKYEADSGEEQLCIPIRWDQEKKVLIRLLTDQDVEDSTSLLKWVEQHQLKINLTVPRQNEEEKKFYYLIGKHLSVEEGLNYIYSDFYNKNCSFIEVLRRIYPKNEISRTAGRDKRCIYCYYPMDNLPCYRCKFCLRYCHQECSPRFNAKDTEAEELSMDIYQTERDEEVWECEECSPCSQCHMPVKKEYLKCGVCGHFFHSICGKLKGPSQASTEGKYTCENCVKCRMCSNKLKNQEYVVEEKNTFCTKCYKDYKNNEYCAMCMKEAGGRWIQCDMSECKNWIHLYCDNYFRDKEAKSALDKANYTCPFCRLKERRKMFKWVIEEMKYFDECGYFYDPQYQDITGYSDVITNPLCIYQMREKAADGTYDDNPYVLMKEDLELIVQNAITFNMPKEDPHYRAKILLIVGSKFLESVKELLECSEAFIINGNLLDIFNIKKKQFYQDIFQNYLTYLLNFRSEKTKIEVKKVAPPPQEFQFFNSKFILSHAFANAEFRFIINKKPQNIENLFNIPRLSPSAWWPIRSRICYYHPQEQNPIIFQCSICRQSYCCTRICLNHRTCSNCNVKGCACDAMRCGCPVLRDKEKKLLQSKVHNALSHSKIQRREYTEYFRYCLKCVSDNLKTHNCYICRGFCYYSYQKCAECGKYYHLKCEKQSRCEEMSIFFEHKADYRSSYSNSKLPGLCHACSCLPKHISHLKEELVKEIKTKASKLSNISRYLPVFSYLYEQNGIRVTQNEIIHLVYENYAGFLGKEKFFSDFLVNFSTVCEHEGNNKIIRNDFRDTFLNDINKKFMSQSSHAHEKCVNFVESKEMKELKQSKKYYKIFLKWFRKISNPAQFAGLADLKTHLDILSSSISHSSGFHFKETGEPYLMSEQSLVATNFKEEVHLNYKNLERIKNEMITAYVSPKSKKNIYYTTKMEKYKNYLNFWNYYYEYKRVQKERKPMVSELLSKTEKEYERYLRIHTDHESIYDCIYKEENTRILLFEGFHYDNFNPFQESNLSNKYKSLVELKYQDNAYLNNKSQMLYKYLTNYCLKIYEENKVVLRRGNTCILNQSKKCWRVLKKYKNQTIELKLEKKEDNWWLHINEYKTVVKGIADIIRKLKELSPEIETFDDVAEYMGFNMTYSLYYQPNHFTNLLQASPLDQFNRQQRKAQVIKTYDSYTWHRQGNFTHRKEEEGSIKEYNYNVTKKEIFYLKKRTQINQQEDQFQPKVTPFITFEDIKKDLADVYTPATKEKDHFAFKEPTNEVYVAPSKIDRLGLFIRTFTKKNTVVTEYIGEIISEAMADMRQKKFHFGCYMFGLTKNNTRFQIIDATFVGNMGRYLNHSCDPNCKARIEIGNGQQPRILIYTVRNVQSNEELTYDYQFKIDNNERLVCKCKAQNCQGRLN